jgi:hypothetical protein
MSHMFTLKDQDLSEKSYFYLDIKIERSESMPETAGIIPVSIHRLILEKRPAFIAIVATVCAVSFCKVNLLAGLKT